MSHDDPLHLFSKWRYIYIYILLDNIWNTYSIIIYIYIHIIHNYIILIYWTCCDHHDLEMSATPTWLYFPQNSSLIARNICRWALCEANLPVQSVPLQVAWNPTALRVVPCWCSERLTFEPHSSPCAGFIGLWDMQGSTRKPSDVNKRYCCKHCYSWKIHHLVAFDFWNTTWPRQAACTTDFCGLPPVSLHSHINIAYLWTHH